jgi:hypothetical protein
MVELRRMVGCWIDECHKRSIVAVKAALNCLAHAIIIDIVRVICDPTHHIGMGIVLKNLFKISWSLPGLIWPMAEALKNFGSFRSTFRTKKLLCLRVWTPIGSCFVEINFRLRNYINYMIGTIGTIMWLPNLTVLRRNSTYVTDFTLYMTTLTNMIKLIPCILLYHHEFKGECKYCGTCNIRFLSEKFFKNHLTLKVKV